MAFLKQNGDVNPISFWEKRRDRIIRTAEEPVLPRFCQIWFWCMAIITGVMVITDIVLYFKYGRQTSFSHLVSNVVVSAFFSWIFFSVILIPLCICGILGVRRRVRENMGLSLGAVKQGYRKDREEHMKDSKNTVESSRSWRVEKPFHLYCRVSICGLAVLGLLWLIFR